jgi:hypothetical protein
LPDTIRGLPWRNHLRGGSGSIGRDRLEHAPMMFASERGFPLSTTRPERTLNMAKKNTPDSAVYRVRDVIGTSNVSWQDAAKNAGETATKTLRDLRIAEVGKLDMKFEDGKVVAYRARASLLFKYTG